MNIKRIPAFLTGLVVMVALAACGGGKNTAATMHLVKTEGTVNVDDAEGESVELMENLGLFSGYALATQAASYGWINLDDTKLAKMDAQSQVDITEEDKLLELNVRSGSLFFNVTEPLADDETMNIRTSTMMVGIRGTCGWVAEDTAALLKGNVSVTAGNQTVTVNAGEMAVLTEEDKLEVEPLTAADIPDFVMEEITGDEDLTADIKAEETAVPDPAEDDPMSAYEASLARMEEDGEILYKEIIDFEQDGSPELLVIHTYGHNEATDTAFVSNTILRKDPEGVSTLWRGGPPWNADHATIKKYSLVEYDGRLYLEEYQRTKWNEGESAGEGWQYYFSVAEEDGTEEDWHRMSVSHNNDPYAGKPYYSYGNTDGNESGPNEISAGEYEAIHGQFSEVRTLVCLYTPNGKDVTVTSNQAEIEEIMQSIEPVESAAE